MKSKIINKGRKMFKKLALSVLTTALIVGVTGCNQDATAKDDASKAQAPKVEAAAPKAQENKGKELTFQEKVAISVGTMYATNLKKSAEETTKFGYNLDTKLLGEAFVSAMNGKAMITEEEAVEVLGEFDRQLRQKMEDQANAEAEQSKAEGEKFLADNAKKEGVTVTASGLQYKITKLGTGEKPKAEDIVRVTYRGTNINGEVFDESKEPVEFPLNGVIKGWTEGLQLLPVGSKVTLYVPADLAYGEMSPSPKIKPNATLVFDVELLEIVKKEEPKAAPAPKADPKANGKKK